MTDYLVIINLILTIYLVSRVVSIEKNTKKS